MKANPNSDNRLIQSDSFEKASMKISFQRMERLNSISTAISHFHRGMDIVLPRYYDIYIYCVGGLIDRRYESSQSLRFTRRGHASPWMMPAGEKIVVSAVRTMADSTCRPAIPATGNH